MSSVRHLGLTVAVHHPAAWVDKGDQIVRDLMDVFAHRDITIECLRHLVAQRGRLIEGHYALPDGGGCLMHLLTEPLGERQISSKAKLIRFFGREDGTPGSTGYIAAEDSPQYQPAKWIVRLVDRQYCVQVRARYGRACEFFDYALVIAVAQQVLTQRAALVHCLPKNATLVAD